MLSTQDAISGMKQELHRLKKRPMYRESTHIPIRCPFCGDSQKDFTDEHLYIKVIPESNGKAHFPFHCKLCGKAAWLMSVSNAQAIGIQNTALLDYIAHIRHSTKYELQKQTHNRIQTALSISPIDSSFMNHKKEYLYARLKNDAICNHPERYKIILDLVSFFKTNGIRPNYSYGNHIRNQLRLLHTNAIGFLSFDNTHINFRYISQNSAIRYMQYALYENKDGTTSGMYVIPTVIDPMQSDISLVMAEGVFDVLRVYLYLHHTRKNVIFAAVMNKHGYTSCIKKFFQYGILFNTISIYSDSDVRIEEYKKSIGTIVPDTETAKIIYYNTAYKDVGDIREPLCLTRRFI